MSSERLHALDAARAIALLAGLALHASLAFIPNMPAIAPGNEPSRSLAMLVVFFAIHVWRMAAFFLIAGFFARMMLQAKGLGGFTRNRLVRIGVPFVVGLPLVMVCIAGVWIYAIAHHGGAMLKPPPPPPGEKPLLPFPLTHLWFLYVLGLLYLVVVPVGGLVARLDRSGRVRAEADRFVAALVRFPLGLAALAAPVCLALYLAPGWMTILCVPTPDHSLVPPPASFAVFGLAFGFGWLLHRQPDLLQLIGRRWALYLALAIAAIAACLLVGGLKEATTPLPQGMMKLAAAARCALAMWASIFALVGICVRFFAAPSRTFRYLADASYWVYLAHLPVLVALQYAVSGLPLGWALKFPLVTAGTLAVTLVTYQHLVRYSFVGAVLNGRRKRPPAPFIPAKAARLELSH